jgi:hypothetical protein
MRVLSRRRRASRIGGAARLRSTGTWNVGGRQQILGDALDATSRHLRGERLAYPGGRTGARDY